MSVQSGQRKVSISTLMNIKREGGKFSCLTAYDFCTAHSVSSAGVDLILVGDSLGMVVQGHDSSLPVTIEDMAYHVRCARRGNQGSLLMADMPFMSYYSEQKTLESAAILMRDGAQMVKLEGGAWLSETTRLLTERGIPVCAHMGLTPQSVNHLGGYRVQGRDPAQAQEIIDEAKILEKSGASVLLLECVPVDLGRRVSESLQIPVIGIGAGPHTDGQIMVWHDLLGLYPGKPAKFVKNFLAATGGSVDQAIRAFDREVKEGVFPAPEHCYQ
jgi:3-methyl-2-oxobutanoate hydroxymethyltransferase